MATSAEADNVSTYRYLRYMTEATDGEEPLEVDEASPNPEKVVDDAAVDVESKPKPASKRKRNPAVERPYPRRTLEDAFKIAEAIKTGNNGKPWPPDQVAKALGMGTGSSFFYLTQASRDFGLTEGTRDASSISLTDLGRKAVFPASPDDVRDARLEAFDSVSKFKEVVDHYGGSKLPADEFVRNTLQTQFGLDPRVHDEFLDFFKKNCRFVGIGADWKGTHTTAGKPKKRQRAGAERRSAANKIDVAGGDADNRPVCFVIMPFVERTDEYSTGFFTEVFASLFKPAIERAGFEAKTAKRQGSDVIQATIVNELLDSDLVLCDLTEHNPNVLFELGVRMHSELPIVLVKATGTNPIFDVDQMLRVESYNPNLWPSTVEADVPKIADHIGEAWTGRETQRSYMSVLRQVASPPDGPLA